jgi:hypothetical protein
LIQRIIQYFSYTVKPSSSINIGIIIGIVVAAVVVVAVVIFTVCILFKRKTVGTNQRNIENNENTGYDDVLSPRIDLLQIPDSQSGYEEPSPYAQLDKSKRVPIAANYQSLTVEKHQAQPHKDFQQHSTPNMSSNGTGSSDSPKELEYVIVP